MTVACEAAEDARAQMLQLFPDGFEEVDHGGSLELVAYVGFEGEERLRDAFGRATTELVADDWAERWRSFHRPVRVGPLWVGPPWVRPPGDAIAVVIDPGRAFGTGAHPTTRLALELLLEAERGSLLDVGCGSGVLSIAAAKLGFAPVHAVDVDAAAAQVTAENVERNAVRVEADVVDAVVDVLPTTDVAVANIALDAVEAIVPRLAAGTIVTSGYLASQRPRLAGLRRARRETVDGWAADLFRRQ